MLIIICSCENSARALIEQLENVLGQTLHQDGEENLSKSYRTLSPSLAHQGTQGGAAFDA